MTNPKPTVDEAAAANKAAKEYADKTVFVSQLGADADPDVMIRNLRFMAYHSGWTDGCAHARQAVRIDDIALDKVIELIDYELKLLYERINRVKGEWPKAGYVKDELWTAWNSNALMLEHLKRRVSQMQLPTLPTEREE